MDTTGMLAMQYQALALCLESSVLIEHARYLRAASQAVRRNWPSPPPLQSPGSTIHRATLAGRDDAPQTQHALTDPKACRGCKPSLQASRLTAARRTGRRGGR